MAVSKLLNVAGSSQVVPEGKTAFVHSAGVRSGTLAIRNGGATGTLVLVVTSEPDSASATDHLQTWTSGADGGAIFEDGIHVSYTGSDAGFIEFSE